LLLSQCKSANIRDAQSHNQASVLLASRDRAGAQAYVERVLKLSPTDIAVLRRANSWRALLERAKFTI
jgi:hypothetical protein